jgi:hypothetical protein
MVHLINVYRDGGLVGLFEVDINRILYHDLGISEPDYLGRALRRMGMESPPEMGNFWRGMCGLPSVEHDRSMEQARQRRVGEAYSAFRSSELTALRHNSCMPMRMWKEAVLVSDDNGNTHAVEKDTYDRYTLAARSRLKDAGGDMAWDF